MAAVSITPDDLAPFAEIEPTKALAMIDDAMAMAAMVAPCILSDTFESASAAKAIIRGAILRWNDAGSGAFSQQTTGPFSVATDTRQPRRSMFWPSEVDQLRKLCDDSEATAFSVDTVNTTVTHAPWCALTLGANYCSCGADIAGFPIFEQA
jgi:hypothetical protein